MTKNLLGKKARIISDNENYDGFRDADLIITHVAHSAKDHQGYDDGLNGHALCDFETVAGVPVPFSLYEYEFELL